MKRINCVTWLVALFFLTNTFFSWSMDKSKEELGWRLSFYKNFENFDRLSWNQALTLAFLTEKSINLGNIKDKRGQVLKDVLKKKNFFGSDFIAKKFDFYFFEETKKKGSFTIGRWSKKNSGGSSLDGLCKSNYQKNSKKSLSCFFGKS